MCIVKRRQLKTKQCIVEGKVIALPALPRCPETVNTLGYWHQGIKITDGIRVANHLTLGLEMSLDSRQAWWIQRVTVRGRGRQRELERRQCDKDLAQCCWRCRWRNGAIGHESDLQKLEKVRKWFVLKFPEESSTATLDFGSLRPIQTTELQSCHRKSVLFETTQLVVTCHSNSRRLTQYGYTHQGQKLELGCRLSVKEDRLTLEESWYLALGLGRRANFAPRKF